MSVQDTKITVPYYPRENKEETVSKVEETPVEKQPLLEPEYGPEIKLESHSEPVNVPEEPKLASVPVSTVEENSDIQRQISTSNDEYEIVSSNSKPTSETDEKDKTPTPSEIEISPSPSPATTVIDIPEISKTPDLFDVEKNTDEKVVSKTYPSIWSKVFSLLNAFMNWIKWVWA